MMKKILSVFLMLVLAVSGIGIFANAGSIEDYAAPFRIVDVDVDGTDMSDVGTLYVERGETLNIRVEVQSASLFPEDGVEDVRVKAEIAGYEYDEIEDITPMFNMNEGDRMVFDDLRLNIPEDMDANEVYKLRIRVYNQDYEVSQTFDLSVNAERHLLDIQRVTFTPGLSLDANQPLFTTVRVENMGYEKEEDIYVEVSVPELGRSGSTTIDELVPYEDTEDEETSQTSDTIYLDLRNAQSGTYELIVKVEYNRGHNEITKSYQLVIDGASSVATSDIMVSATETSLSAAEGEGIVYNVNIVNMGSNTRSFTAEVSGLDWANYKVDPTPVIVQAGSSAEMFVYVSPKDDVLGQKTFTLNVREGNKVVEQINFNANIGGKEKSEWGNVLTGLEIGFVVLLIILVILGIILAVTKMGKKEDEEPLGESYY